VKKPFSIEVMEPSVPRETPMREPPFSHLCAREKAEFAVEKKKRVPAPLRIALQEPRLTLFRQ